MRRNAANGIWQVSDSAADYATHEDIRRLDGSIGRLETRLEQKLDRLDNRLWMFMATILVFTLGIVVKEVL